MKMKYLSHVIKISKYSKNIYVKIPISEVSKGKKFSHEVIKKVSNEKIKGYNITAACCF